MPLPKLPCDECIILAICKPKTIICCDILYYSIRKLYNEYHKINLKDNKLNKFVIFFDKETYLKIKEQLHNKFPKLRLLYESNMDSNKKPFMIMEVIQK